MKKILLLLILPILSACTGYGDKVVYNGTEVYYKDGATKEDADKLGAYLQESEFADGNEKSVMLVKNEAGNFVFRMVVQEQFQEGSDFMFQLMAMGLSMSVFDNQPVDVDICDNTFGTIRTIPYSTGDESAELETGEMEFDMEDDSLTVE